MKEAFTANMAHGPQLYSFALKRFFYGAYHILNFSEQDQGKELKVTVESTEPVCWIELWPAVYDGQDWVRWTTERGEHPLVHTDDQPQVAPTFTWRIQPGGYTVYFVKSSLVRRASAEIIKYQIEIN